MLTKTALFTILSASTFAMASLLTGCGCGSYDPQGNHIDMGSETDQGNNTLDCSCVQQYGSSAMDTASIQRLSNEGLATCFGKDPSEIEKQAACLPTVVGQDARNGRDIQVYYYCGDDCPDAGYVGVAYRDVADKAACCSMGGDPIIDPAFNTYVACAPAALGTGATRACAN